MKVENLNHYRLFRFLLCNQIFYFLQMLMMDIQQYHQVFVLNPVIVSLSTHQTVNGVKMKVVGDVVDPKERTLIIMNHRTRLDWLFLWAFIVRHGMPNHEKIVLKASLKNVPGAGWGLQLCAFLFLYRKWKKDKEHMIRLLTYFTNERYPLQLLIFPEGTDYCPNTKRSSDRYADKAGVKRFEYVLHPRTKGFATCAMLLRGHGYKLLNLSMAYKDEVPDNEAVRTRIGIGV